MAEPQGSFLPKYQNPEFMLAVKFNRAKLFTGLWNVSLFSPVALFLLWENPAFLGVRLSIYCEPWIESSVQLYCPRSTAVWLFRLREWEFSPWDMPHLHQSHTDSALPCTNAGWREEWRDKGQTPCAALLCTAGPNCARNLHSAC